MSNDVPADQPVTIEVKPGGPYRITGPVTIMGEDGERLAVDADVVKLCRCGTSQTKPFCDASHNTSA